MIPRCRKHSGSASNTNIRWTDGTSHRRMKPQIKWYHSTNNVGVFVGVKETIKLTTRVFREKKRMERIGARCGTWVDRPANNNLKGPGEPSQQFPNSHHIPSTDETRSNEAGTPTDLCSSRTSCVLASRIS